MKLRLVQFGMISLLLTAAAWLPGTVQGEEPIRVLLLHGGHGFDKPNFFQMFDRMEGIRVTVAEFPQASDRLKPGLEKEFDVIVTYDMVKGLTAGQHQAFDELLKRGIGYVALHHALGGRPEWEGYRKVLGGRWIWEQQEIDGKTYPKSTWRHGERIPVVVADKEHPITEGLDDFEIIDEVYGGLYVSPDVHVLLRSKHPDCNPEIAWVTRYGGSPVFYLMLGHDNQAWSNPVYPMLVLRGIHWAHQASWVQRME